MKKDKHVLNNVSALIDSYSDYIDKDDISTIYSLIPTKIASKVMQLAVAGTLTEILLKANINPLKNMWYVPEGYGTFNDALPNVYYLNIRYIAENAFYECDSLNTILLDNIEEIAEYAFRACRNLTTIYLSNIEKVKQFAFTDTPKLQHVMIENVNYLDHFAMGWNNLSDIKFRGTTKDFNDLLDRSGWDELEKINILDKIIYI